MQTNNKTLTDADVRRIATDIYNQLGTQYGVARVPSHDHKNINSTQLDPDSSTAFAALPSTTGGVASPAKLNGQVINNPVTNSNPNLASLINSSSIFVAPLPVVYASGSATFNGGEAPIGTVLISANPTEIGVSLWVRVNTVPGFTNGTFHFTSGLSAGATSGTLTTNWTSPTGIYWIVFSDGETRPAGFVKGSTAVNWSTGGLTGGVNSTIQVSAIGWYGFPATTLIPV